MSISPWLQIVTFSPEAGWPGSILAIEGLGFSDDRDANMVEVGGVRALVLDVAPNRLQVLVGEGASSGAVRITVNGTTAVSAQPFRLLSWPDGVDPQQVGPPIFFHGPQEGTPQRGVANQPVLVVLTFPTDHDPGTPVQRTALRTAEEASFNNADRFWREASYGTTTWDFTYTDWLALPRDRNYYFWEPRDLDEARRYLYRRTRRSAVVSGSRLYAAHQGLALGVVDVTNPTAPQELSWASFGDMVTGVRVVGSRAYVTAGQEGLYILDINITPPITLGLPWSSPTVLGHVPVAAWLHGLDVAGNLLAVAAEETGLILFDLTMPNTPIQVGAFAFGTGNRATAVRLVGSRAYVAAGTSLHVVDISNPAAPVEVGNINTVAWGLGVDVNGSLCAVATDGDGLHLYDVTNPAPAARGVLRTVPRIHGVDLSGGVAYVAAADGGLRIVDVSNPVAPTELAQLTTSPPTYAVVVDAGRAYLSTGARTLTLVDVSLPATPTPTGSVVLASTVIGIFDPDLIGLRNAIPTAANLQNLAKRHDALMVHALGAAQAVGHNLNDFQGFIVVVNGPFLRGQSWTADKFTFEGASVSFNGRKGVIYIAMGAHWGRKSHEIGHWLGMWDIYTEWYADGTYLPGTATPWDMAGDSDDGPLFSGHQIHEVMQFFNPTTNVAERVWSPTAPPLNETFDMIAHDIAQDVDPNRIHLLKLRVAEGLTYYVEIRQRPGTVIFDPNIPIPASSTVQGAVLVTRATQGTTISNTFERPIMMFGVLDVGERVIDAARRLEIEVESIVQNRPLVYRVRLRWNQPLPNAPGQFDLFITPWDTSRWETIDIWVDSPRNNTGGIRNYEFSEPGQPTKPILNGDRPWTRRRNLIFARIRNTGAADATDVYVTFYVNSPPGIGDNGAWATLGTEHVPLIPAADPAVPGSGIVEVSHDWIPAGGSHTCLKVAIMPKAGEIEAGNNMAQENVFTFDSAASSSHQPVTVEAEVRSPFVVWRRVDLVVRGLPAGWHAVVDHAWVWVPPLGSRAVRAVIWTDLGTPAADRFDEIPALALARVEGWTDFDHRYLPIGGIMAAVKATRKVRPQCEVRVTSNQLQVQGCLEPALSDVPITIEITDAAGTHRYIYLQTDERGCFILRPNQEERGEAWLEKGTYTVQVFVTAGSEAAETECEPVRVQVT